MAVTNKEFRSTKEWSLDRCSLHILQLLNSFLKDILP
jgi:hypothetical protein